MAPQLFDFYESDTPGAREIKAKANELWTAIFETYKAVPATGTAARQRAIARTKLEEAVMWATNGAKP